MGTFDPAQGVVDDERQDGNIMNALMQFPQRYTFHVVGRIRKSGGDDGDDDGRTMDEYADAVKGVVLQITGDDDEVVCKITPRGKAFVKIQCEANVQSVSMINTIYDDLDKMEQTVMRF